MRFLPDTLTCDCKEIINLNLTRLFILSYLLMKNQHQVLNVQFSENIYEQLLSRLNNWKIPRQIKL